MIILNCDNNLISTTIENLLIQKSINFSLTETNSYFLKIVIRSNKNSIIIENEHINKKFEMPININDFLLEFINLLSGFYINFYNASYYPFQNKIILSQKNLILKNIHSIILFNLTLYKDGVDKEYLYSLVWPEDKNLSINKLDSHLTNLKNYIKESLDLSMNFHSSQKIIKLII